MSSYVLRWDEGVVASPTFNTPIFVLSYLVYQHLHGALGCRVLGFWKSFIRLVGGVQCRHINENGLTY